MGILLKFNVVNFFGRPKIDYHKLLFIRNESRYTDSPSYLNYFASNLIGDFRSWNCLPYSSMFDKLNPLVRNYYYFIFLKIFGGHMSFLWGHWYPCFGLLVTSALGFKARVDSLACFLACMLFLRFTSGATPADLLTASMAAEPLWPTYLQPSDISTSIGCVEVWAVARTYGLGRGSNPWPTVQQHSALNHSTIPARLTGKKLFMDILFR